jgi:hypothetical protein
MDGTEKLMALMVGVLWFAQSMWRNAELLVLGLAVRTAKT